MSGVRTVGSEAARVMDSPMPDRPSTSPPAPKRVADSRTTLQQLMMPEHANIVGTVHGGMIMRLCDEAGALCAMRHAQRNCVTVWMDSMTFESPVHVGEVLQLNATINYVGRTSMEVGVKVLAEDPIRGVVTHTNSAYLVFVALDDDRRPAPVPALIVENEDEKRRYQEGEARHQRRVANKR